MKYITIHSDHRDIVIQDDDTTNLSEYAEKVSEILNSPTVAILETSEGSLIIRPHKINSIHVAENNDTAEINKENQQENSEDLITDGD